MRLPRKHCAGGADFGGKLTEKGDIFGAFVGIAQRTEKISFKISCPKWKGVCYNICVGAQKRSALRRTPGALWGGAGFCMKACVEGRIGFLKEHNLEKSIVLENASAAAELFGSFDVHAKRIEKTFDVALSCRDSQLKISGEEAGVAQAARTVESLLGLIAKGEALNDQNVGYCIDMVREDREAQMMPLAEDCICITAKGKPVKPKTVGQKAYCDNIRKNTVTIGVGPAGTGKTYLAVAMAVTAFRAQQVNRIILTRPAVEAGEKLGFLPGDLQQKVDPYLRPLYDALFDMLGAETYQKYVERGNIEVAPLAYMRGRTLDDSFVILDEAQNTTCEQMKMFLTRLGFNSKMVITGDITQIDLPDGKKSGLRDAMRVLRNVDDISIFRFTEKDVVRHRLVQDIIRAYERASASK